MGTRRQARELAMQALFYMDIQKNASLQMLENFCENFPPSKKSRPFFLKLVKGVLEARSELDDLIERFSRNWKITRMSCVDRNVMRIAVYELLYCDDIPAKVSINEAVDVGKKFGTEESGAFINGIMDSIRGVMEKEGSPKKEGNLIIKSLAVGPIQANCFVLGCEETLEAVVIDPGDEADRILHALAESSLTAKFIINTHGHFDHVGANKRLNEATGAPILIHPLDAPMLNQLSISAAAWGLAADNSPAPERELKDGDKITFGNITLTVLHTPGHSPGGISIYAADDVFVGDTLFAGSVGRTDLPGGSFLTLKESIQKKLFVLGDDVRVHTGHGPSTTIGEEKRLNPFVGERATFFG